MRARRRRGSASSAELHGKKSGLKVGHVHPNPPSSIHNPIRAIEHKTNKDARIEDYVRKHGFSLG